MDSVSLGLAAGHPPAGLTSDEEGSTLDADSVRKRERERCDGLPTHELLRSGMPRHDCLRKLTGYIVIDGQLWRDVTDQHFDRITGALDI